MKGIIIIKVEKEEEHENARENVQRKKEEKEENLVEKEDVNNLQLIINN